MGELKDVGLPIFHKLHISNRLVSLSRHLVNFIMRNSWFIKVGPCLLFRYYLNPMPFRISLVTKAFSCTLAAYLLSLNGNLVFTLV